MVYGIGCDLCSIARMEKSLLGPHGAVFARRVFGPAEQAALGLPLAEEERPRRLSSRRRAPVCGSPSPSARSKPSACPAGHRPIAFLAGAPSGWKHAACGHISL